MYHTTFSQMIQYCLMKEHAKVTQSRAAIQEAGIQTLLRNPDAGMSEIALAAGVGRATLYRHFESREVLVQGLAQKCFEETDALMEPIKTAGLEGREAIEATIDVLMPMANRFRFLMSLWTIAADNAAVKKIYARQLKELSELVKEAQNQGDISSTLSVQWVVSTFDAILNSAWNMIERGELTPKAASSSFKQTFFSGCA